MADSSAARNYINEANELIASQDFDRALKKLELADIELEDLTGDEKTAVAQLLKESQASIATARASQHKPKYLRMLRNLMDSAESDIGNLVTWPGTERQLNELFADETAKAAIPDEIAEAQPKFNTFRKLHTRKAAAEYVEQVEREVVSAEEQWKETKESIEENGSTPRSDDYQIERSRRYLDDARKRLELLAADSDAAKGFAARLNTIDAELTAIVAGAQIEEVAATLQRRFESYDYEYGGWEEETDDGPTWDDYSRQQGERMSAFFAPRTRAFRERIEDFLTRLDDDSDYQEVASADKISAFVDDVREKLARANASLLSRVQTVVNGAQSAEVKDENAFERLEGDIRRALGEASAQTQALMAKVRGKLSEHEAGVANAEQQAADQLEMLFTRAEEVWPSMHAGLTWAEEIDLSQVGQHIGFYADNLMGYRFKPTGQYFVTTIGGTPVAAKIDADTMAGIKAIEEAIGRSLGDDDRDGKWDVVAMVTDKKAKLMIKRSAESSGTVDGMDVTLSTDYAEPVDGVVIEFLAAKCGPFAGAKGRGVLKPDGTVG